MMDGHNFIVVYKYRNFFEIILLLCETLNNSKKQYQYYLIQLNIDNESKFCKYTYTLYTYTHLIWSAFRLSKDLI